VLSVAGFSECQKLSIRRSQSFLSVALSEKLHSEKRGFPECCSVPGTRGRYFFFLKKRRSRPAINGVNSSSSVSMTLEKGFSEYTIFSSRGRRLSRGTIPLKTLIRVLHSGKASQVHLHSRKPLAAVVDAKRLESSENIIIIYLKILL